MQVETVKTTGSAATTLDSVRPMIRLVVKDIAIREGIDNPNALAEKTGLPYETCRRVWNDNSKHIGLSTIEALCDALRVRPGQLFDYEYEPDKKQATKGKR
ncbi:MAG TPA: helix-turn-helix transcriptional regulator [Blastocatellia bacterium]|nr:helix-turn-helix transcriptional regulator [Blastocatellia bacterium]